MNDQAAHIGASRLLAHPERASLTSAVLLSLGMALTGCGGGGDSTTTSERPQDAAAPVAVVTQTTIVPLSATFAGRTYPQWVAESWQWAMGLPLPTYMPTTKLLAIPPSNAPSHPFLNCNRPISLAQTGRTVWFWSAPDLATDGGPLRCDQSTNIIPASTAILLTTRDVEASSLDAPPFQANFIAAQNKGDPPGQQDIAKFWADHITGLFCIIDEGKPNEVRVPLQNFRVLTPQFTFNAPTPWIFNSHGGYGTAVADGYYVLLQLPPGTHTIHYGGKFHFDAGTTDPTGLVTFDQDTDFPKDVTLILTIGAA